MVKALEPLMAAASSSPSMLLAVPGWPTSSRPRLAGQRHHAAFDQRTRADELRLDDHGPGAPAGKSAEAGARIACAMRAAQEIDDALGRQQPALRPR